MGDFNFCKEKDYVAFFVGVEFGEVLRRVIKSGRRNFNFDEEGALELYMDLEIKYRFG